MSEAIGDFLRTPAPWLLIPYATCPSFPATMLLRMTMCGWGGLCGWLLTLRVWPIRAFRGHCDIYDESLGFRGDDTTG